MSFKLQFKTQHKIHNDFQKMTVIDLVTCVVTCDLFYHTSELHVVLSLVQPLLVHTITIFLHFPPSFLFYLTYMYPNYDLSFNNVISRMYTYIYAYVNKFCKRVFLTIVFIQNKGCVIQPSYHFNKQKRKKIPKGNTHNIPIICVKEGTPFMHSTQANNNTS